MAERALDAELREQRARLAHLAGDGAAADQLLAGADALRARLQRPRGAVGGLGLPRHPAEIEAPV